jgi:RNA polymerase sigma factor (sigma-70 family)
LTITQAIEDIKNKGEEGLRFIINEYEQNVYNTVLGLVQNQANAEELTQDVFVKVYHKISSFKGEAAFSTWLYRIAVNESLSFLRKQKAKKRFAIFSFLGNKEEATAIDFVHPGIILEQKENATILFKAIKKLPEQQQIAFVLKNIEQLKQNEIASIMQITEGAVEALIQRAKQGLRKELDGGK